MGYFTTKITSNLNFGNAAKKMDEIIESVPDHFGIRAQQTMMGNIGDGRHQPLAEKTRVNRRLGIGWEGKKVKPVTEDIPLIQTGNLYRSLMYNKKTNSINIEGYGLMHHKGFVNDNKLKVPARPFLDLVEDPDTWLNSTLTVGRSVIEFDISSRVKKLILGKNIKISPLLNY